jgi:ArsR family transcriptional regulator, arsenate/arsenite/antimonite-responsive transcriptional repressor
MQDSVVAGERQSQQGQEQGHVPQGQSHGIGQDPFIGERRCMQPTGNINERQCLGYTGGVASTVSLEACAPERVKGCCVAVAPLLADEQADELAALFRALADPTRVQMLHLLKAATEPICVCDFTAAFDLGQPTVSHHLAKLKEAGLVTRFKRGVWSFYSLRRDLAEATRATLALIP